jgi:hypothetical protein
MPHCLCGCGEETAGGQFMPGHDQRYRTDTENMVGGAQALRRLVEEALRYQRGEASVSDFSDIVRSILIPTFP